MVKIIKEEKLKWVLPIANKEVRLIDVAKVCPHGKRSLERWIAAYKANGEVGLEPKSTEPKTQEKETPIWIKERVIEVRKKTKKCALKTKDITNIQQLIQLQGGDIWRCSMNSQTITPLNF